MADHIAATLDKAREGGAHPAELAALRRRLEQLTEPGAGQLPGARLEPMPDLPRLTDLPEPSDAEAREVLDRLVVLKLNGGLGTSMGLSGPKSLLEVKPGQSFLDIIARQVLALRERHGARLPLVLMNSAGTRDASLAALRRHEIDVDGVPLDFLQGREPKLRETDLLPVEWPADPELEWCPPGHGDLYTAMAVSGALDALLAAGLRWCFVSNSDNLGALADPRLAAWMARERAPFVMEAVRGTPADRKGGHLARHRGRTVLRETAQVPDGDPSFGDIDRWRYYNTNNLWVDLEALRDLQERDPGAPALPLIVNRKTVDPTDSASTPVIQLETAMGAAVGAIEGARAVEVPRTRFAPVKTTDDLLVVRSDAYELRPDGVLAPTFDGTAPHVSLDRAHYKLMADFEARFPSGAPSLRRCTSLAVEGDVTFGAEVVVEGDVRVTGPRHVADGEALRG
ncbi:UTP--glucose-1-phosphate uridylyltransferase [Georgenia yuyongxinii]|uniref:UTP--glucose-1-phosphate uridylyltransferase n=1 Tax=Georgenia yuyongxinii TaxID=2589797 RepID=A0A5B8C3F8_9MICO|nr:UTP--glucose-1-phosphate uridylyltransferase [Georgenia yuyongxinii]QDC24041.1 UTP--glucose-1-phosphate uridylyltransferase [Georgenia yuyongxinii]